jgi:sec-independent protein translocase protein TatA
MLPFGFLGYSFGGPELLVVAFIALLLFGNRLPNIMRSLGKSVTEFKKGVQGIEEEIDRAAVAEEKKSTTD